VRLLLSIKESIFVKVKDFRPMKDKVFLTEMDEGIHVTAGGIILQDDMGKEHGIRPRWGRVAFVGTEVDYVSVGEWVLVEHGRWTKRINLEIEGQPPLDIWMIDPEAILVVSDQNHSHQQITF
jgi:co-chaperonin GroES (HSP10)